MKKVYIKDKQDNKVLPITHVSAVLDDNGNDIGSVMGAFEDEVSTALAGKQDTISDLATIRSGAALGATAKQPATTIAGYGITDAYTKQEVNNLVSTPHQQYVTVATKADLDAITTGSADTIYRVSNYDGSQVDATKYAEYAWNGTQFMLLSVKSAVGEVFDVSEYNSGATYDTLAQALAAVPAAAKRGGMSIKFVQGSVQNSDNKYVQYRLMADSFTTDTTQWQGVDDKPAPGGKNTVESGGIFAQVFVADDWNNAPEFKATILSTGFGYNDANGKIKIFKIKPGDSIAITGSENTGYYAILNELPVQGLSTIPFATGYDHRIIIEANTSYTFSVAVASDAKYLIVEASRTVNGVITDETPVVFTINTASLLIDRKELVDRAIRNLKQGIFIPRFNSFVEISDATISIPKSKVVYNNQYFESNNTVTLNRVSGRQYEIIVFNLNNQTFENINPQYDFINSNYLFCFYVRNDNRCSLSTSLYKVNSEFTFIDKAKYDALHEENLENEIGYLNNNPSAPISYTKLFSIPGNKVTTTAMSNVTLVKGAKYRCFLKFANSFSYTGGFAVKICNAESDTAILNIYQAANTTIESTTFEFTWENDTVYNYRICFRVTGVTINIKTELFCSINLDELYSLNRIQKTGTFIPNYSRWVNITDTSITIPANSRVYYDGTTYYQNTEAVSLERTFGAQYQIVVFDIANKVYLLKNATEYDLKDKNSIFCFYVRNHGECSLSPSLYKYNGNFAFVAADDYYHDIESIFAYNDKKELTEKLIQLKSIQDGYNSVTANIGALSTTPSMFTILHFSDIHADVNNLTRIVEFWNEFKDTYISDIIHTGDAAWSKIDDEYSVPMVFERVSGAERILNVVGNHDAWLTGTSWYEATGKQSYDYLFKGTGNTPLVDNWDVTQPSNAESLGLCYYYKDYASKNIRLIVLDSMHYTQGQEDWFGSVLTDAKTNSYHVIVAVHYQSQYGLTAKQTTFNCLSGDVAEITTATDIPDITGVYHVERLPKSAYQKVAAFITAGGSFICWMCGHTHKDYFGVVPGYTNQLQITIDTANRTKGDNYNWESRINHTQSCDCFNIVGFDTLHKIIKIVRIGVNRDSRMRLIDTMCYDYLSGTVISNN